MLELLAKTRRPIGFIRTLAGIMLLAIVITWLAFQTGINHGTLKTIAIWCAIGYVGILILLNFTSWFSIETAAVKPIMSLLLVINLTGWSSEDFSILVDTVSILTLVYFLLLAYDKYFNKIAYRIAVDNLKELDFEPFEYDYQNNRILAEQDKVEKIAIRSIIKTFKNKYQEDDKVFAYHVKTTPNTNGNMDITIDFALNGKRPIKLFDVILSYSEEE